MSRSGESPPSYIGALSGLLANVLLGVSSVFWKLIGSLSAVTLVSYRVYLSLLTAFLVVYACGGVISFFKRLKVWLVFLHMVTAILVAVNWGVFIWASIHGRVVESSIGYLVAPLLSVVVGIVFYKERVTVFKTVAVLIMLAGLVGLVSLSDELYMWVYLAIGLTWGIYCCLKKITILDAFSGLLLESFILSVFCIGFLSFSDLSMNIPVDFDAWRILLVFSCGFVSIVPLALLSFAARRLTSISMGLLQFVLPVTQFLVAVFVYKQEFSRVVVFGLLVIVCGLLVVVFEPVFKKTFSFKECQKDGA